MMAQACGADCNGHTQHIRQQRHPVPGRQRCPAEIEQQSRQNQKQHRQQPRLLHMTGGELLIEDQKGNQHQHVEPDIISGQATLENQPRRKIDREQNPGNEGTVEMLLTVQQQVQHIDQTGCRRQDAKPPHCRCICAFPAEICNADPHRANHQDGCDPGQHVFPADKIGILLFHNTFSIAIFLFSYFGIFQTRQISAEDTDIISGEIEGKAHFDYGTGRSKKPRIHYYKFWINGEKYRLNVSEAECEKLEKILATNDSPTLEFRVYRHPFSKEIVEFYHSGEELATLYDFNCAQTSARIAAIILFVIAEVIAIPLYTVYTVFHRTSKDRIYFRRNKNEKD